jgi:signal transduction histidine kinase
MMNVAPRPNRHPGFSADWAFVLTVVAGYVSALLSPPGQFTVPEIITLIALGVVYSAIGVYGFAYCGRAGAAAVTFAYFAVQILLAGAILYLSLGSGFVTIIVLPLISHSLVLLSRRRAVVVSVVIVLVYVAVIGAISSLRVAIQAGTAVLAGAVFVAIFTEIALREQKARAEVERLAANLREANDKLRGYAAQVEELATAKERNRLAREIHDSLGHYLTVINVQLEAARAILGSDPSRALDALLKAQSLAQEGLTDVRRSVAALRAGPIENRPLPEAIATLADQSRAAGIVTELSVAGDPRPLSPQTELTLYRAAQEGLTNIRKHAHASRVEIALDYRESDRVRLRVHDNGVGGSATDDRRDGYGLLGVSERAQLLGGEVRVRAEEGQGFTLEVELPA